MFNQIEALRTELRKRQSLLAGVEDQLHSEKETKNGQTDAIDRRAFICNHLISTSENVTSEGRDASLASRHVPAIANLMVQADTGEITPDKRESSIPRSGSQTSNTPSSQLCFEILYLQKLVEFLEAKFVPIKRKMETLLLNDNITFDLLWCLFPEGREVTFKDKNSGLTCAGKVFSILMSFLMADYKLHIFDASL